MKNCARTLLTVVVMATHLMARAEAPLPAYDRLPTELAVKGGKFEKTSAGDVIELKITLPSTELAADFVPTIADKLKDGPVEWGTGRILSWARGEGPDKGKIIINLTTYTPGEFVIAPIPLKREMTGDPKRETKPEGVATAAPAYASEEKKVLFFAIGGDRQKDDIYPPEDVLFPKWLIVLIGVIALLVVLGALALVGRWYGRRVKEKKALASAPRVLTPLEEFEKARAATERKGFLEKQAFKPHYFSLSDAAKRFLGRAYRFNAEERTTRELVSELEALAMPDTLIDEWEKLFDEMDATKFTDQKPELNAARSLSERLASLAAKSYRISPVAKDETTKLALAPGGLPGSVGGRP